MKGAGHTSVRIQEIIDSLIAVVANATISRAVEALGDGS